eukprot:COSAG01_NODE_18851_length_1049_cov_0.994737_2_plen_74_part_01
MTAGFVEAADSQPRRVGLAAHPARQGTATRGAHMSHTRGGSAQCPQNSRAAQGAPTRVSSLPRAAPRPITSLPG